MVRNEQPFPSWTWNEEENLWYPPHLREVKEGDDPNQSWIWNEEKLDWEHFPITGSNNSL
jgi:hypothetical protein